MDVTDFLTCRYPFRVVVPCLHTLSWRAVEEFLIDFSVDASCLVPCILELVIERVLAGIGEVSLLDRQEKT